MPIKDFFLATLLNVRKEPDGKLVFTFFLSSLVLLDFPIQWVFSRGIPEYMFWASLTFIAAAFGIDGFLTAKQISVENPSPTINVAKNGDIVNEAS